MLIYSGTQIVGFPEAVLAKAKYEGNIHVSVYCIIQMEITPQLVAARMHEHKWVYKCEPRMIISLRQKHGRKYSDYSIISPEKRVYHVHITNRYRSKLIKASLD